MLRRAPILAVACLLALPASAWASLPGTPSIIVGTTTTCSNAAGRGGSTINTCVYSGTQLTLNGWSLKNGVCTVAGTFTDTADRFTTPSNGRSFSLSRGGVIPDPIAGINFQFSCPLTWTGAVGLSWGKAITGGTSTTPIWTLHVRNNLNTSRQAHCLVSYRNDLNQTKHYTWSPTVPADGLAKTRIRVWHVNSLGCSYTLTRKLQASGSA